jgi:protein TonB
MWYQSIDSSDGHLSVRIDGCPDIAFQFARQPRRLTVAILSAFACQLGILAVVLAIGRSGPRQAAAQLVASAAPQVIFLPGADLLGGGGGGGGNQMLEPPRPAKIPKPTSLVVAPLQQAQIDPAPLPQFSIPVTTLAEMELPGTLVSPASLSTSSQGPGRDGGGGDGKGRGIGGGDGAGLGPGSQAGMGGGPYAPGTGSTDPVPLYRAEPQYTAAAVMAHVIGEVWVECTVLPDGTCVGARVIRSLDPRFGLDQEAIKAAGRWRFRPGRDREGRPVPFLVSIAVEFNIR